MEELFFELTMLVSRCDFNSKFHIFLIGIQNSTLKIHNFYWDLEVGNWIRFILNFNISQFSLMLS